MATPQKEALLRENIQAQLVRLTNQLADIEEMKDEMEPEEYESEKKDTLKSLREFQESLAKMSEGNLSLVSSLEHLRMTIQAAISAAFKTPEGFIICRCATCLCCFSSFAL
jgi:hypothetical protein